MATDGNANDAAKRYQQAIQALVQSQSAGQGVDPALANPGAPSPIATAASGAPPPGYSSYVGQQNGGVQTGSQSPLETLVGINNTTVTPAIQSSLPDAGDAESVNRANAEYQQRLNDWEKQRAAMLDYVQKNGGVFGGGAKALVDWTNANPKPAPPDALAIQRQSDRDRLLKEGADAYGPLIASLSSAAAGNGPSAALNYYRAAADDANRRTLGVAASGRGTGGQRAALFQAAMRQNAEATQGAANQAAQIGAQEQNQARGSLNVALAGLTNLYGSQNLLGDTSHQQDQNQNAENQAIGLNSQIAAGNAKNTSDFAKEAVKTTAEVASNA